MTQQRFGTVKSWLLVSQLVELQKGVMIRNNTWLLKKKYKGLTSSETLHIPKQKLTALATMLKRYTREAEAKNMPCSPKNHPSYILNCNAITH